MDLRVTGYIRGTFAPFTPAVARYLKECTEKCDTLLVEVTSKGTTIAETIGMVSAITVVPYESSNLYEAYERHNFDVVFTGDSTISASDYSTFASLVNSVRVEYVEYVEYEVGSGEGECFVSTCLDHMFKREDELGPLRII